LDHVRQICYKNQQEHLDNALVAFECDNSIVDLPISEVDPMINNLITQIEMWAKVKGLDSKKHIDSFQVGIQNYHVETDEGIENYGELAILLNNCIRSIFGSNKQLEMYFKNQIDLATKLFKKLEGERKKQEKKEEKRLKELRKKEEKRNRELQKQLENQRKQISAEEKTKQLDELQNIFIHKVAEVQYDTDYLESFVDRLIKMDQKFVEETGENTTIVTKAIPFDSLTSLIQEIQRYLDKKRLHLSYPTVDMFGPREDTRDLEDRETEYYEFHDIMPYLDI
jgi:hypothetical protein